MRVLLGMSGGVDSTYAVEALRAMGHEVEGAVIKMHGYTEISEARIAADALGVTLHLIDGTSLFEQNVVKPFVEEYKKGRTPNPCIICNREVKFKLLYDYSVQNGFDKIATGHYADIACINDEHGTRHALRRSADDKKDQTYMLWRLPEKILAALIFPLAEKKKSEVKLLAEELELSAAYRGESQEICFIPDGKYAEFIEKRSGACPEGNFVDESGKILGRHKGIVHYTIGQRKGLGIALGERAFITDINPETNDITLSTKDTHSYKFTISDLVFTGLPTPEPFSEAELDMKHRYLAPLAKSRIRFLPGGKAEVTLDTPARAVTPGQSAVFYKDGVLMFGGIIDKAY